MKDQLKGYIAEFQPTHFPKNYPVKQNTGMTVGKKYEIIGSDEDYIEFINDNGNPTKVIQLQNFIIREKGNEEKEGGLDLITYTPMNTSIRTPISFFVTLYKTGQIALNQGTIQMMGLKEGDRIAFSQTKDDPENLYIHKCDHGFLLKNRSPNSSTVLAFYSINLSRRIAEIYNRLKGETHKFPVSKKPLMINGEPYFLIINNKPVVNSQRNLMNEGN